MSEEKLISQKKPIVPLSDRLTAFLKEYNRQSQIPISYQDLLRYAGSVAVFDKNDNDTLWARLYYNDFERNEIDLQLKRVYSIFHSDGSDDILQFLNIDAIDYCTFGNSKPFRIKVRNVLNDNYTYFYVKKADASRVYGLELEHMLSPYNLSFLTYQDTLIEEHIAGIPGDVFIEEHLANREQAEKSQIAKEFVKFNERCTIRLLGDMRSYNYVFVPVHDFDQVVYRIRAIDFDQQSYEKDFKVYRPQFFKENISMVKLVQDRLTESSVNQYKNEERSMIAKRMLGTENRLEKLLDCMINDSLAPRKHVEQLRGELYRYTHDLKFKRSENMGQLLQVALDFVKRNYQNINMKRLLRS